MADISPEEVANKQVSNRLEETNQQVRQDPYENKPMEQVGKKPKSNQEAQPAQEEILKAQNFIKDNNIDANAALESINNAVNKFSQVGQTPSAFDIASQMDEKAIPFYDKYEGSVADDFYNSMMNAGYVRTAQGVANAIPTIVSAVSDADWAANWIDEVNVWAEGQQGLISDVGQKSFFDTWDMRSLAAGAGQGLGSMIPMVAATVLTGGFGGVAGLVGGFGARTAAGIAAQRAALATGKRLGAWGIGKAAAQASFGGTAQVLASSLNMMPALQEEGLSMGLNHQQASGLALAVAPIIGLMEKTGLEAAVGAGFRPAIAKIEKEVIKNSFKEIAETGALSASQFDNSIKVALGSLAKNYRKELVKKGVPNAYLKAGAKEAKLRMADFATRTAQGAGGEASMEFLQSMTETAAKQMYDNYIASEEAKVGEGKFGANVLSEEAFIQALEEGFYGGLIGGSFSGASRMAKGLRAETITSALDKANSRGTLTEETERMNKIIDGLRNDPKDKQELKKILQTSSEIVGSISKQDVSNTAARMQVFQLAHYTKDLQSEIEGIQVDGDIEAINENNKQKVSQLKEQIAENNKAIADILVTNNTVDLDSYKKVEEAKKETKEEKKGFFGSVASKVSEGLETVKKTIVPSKEVISDEEYKTFTDEGTVSPEILNNIAEKVKTKDELTKREEAIYADKGSEIEQILKESVTAEPKAEIKKEPIKEPTPAKETKVDYGVDDELTFYDGTEGKVVEVTDKGVKVEFRSPDGAMRQYSTYSQEELINEAEITKKVAPVSAPAVKPAKKTGVQKIDNLQSIAEGFTNTSATTTEQKIADLQDSMKTFFGGTEYASKEELKADIDDEMTRQGTTMMKAAYRANPEQFIDALIDEAGVKITKEVSAEPSVTKTVDGIKPEGKAEATPNAAKEAIALEGGIKGGWTQVLNSLNRREGKKKGTDITIERFNALSDEQVREIAKTSPTAQAEMAKRAEATKAAEPEVEEEVTPTEEPVAEKPNQAEELANEPLPTDEDFGEEANEIIKKRARRNPKRRPKKAVQGAGMLSPISANPKQFARVLSHLRKMFPNIKIEVVEELYDENGLEVLGLATTGGIKINENSATQDTAFHELGHHFVKMLSGTRLYNDGIEMIKNTPYMKMAKELYPNESVEDQAEEALMMLVGEESVDMINTKLDGNLLQKALTWLKKFWNKIKYQIGKASAKDIAEIMAADIAYRNSPVMSSGIVIDGNKYSKTYAKKDLEGHIAVRNASIIGKIEYDALPNKLKRNRKFVKSLFNNIFADEYAYLQENDLLPKSVDTYEKWKVRHAGALNTFMNQIDAPYLFEDVTEAGLLDVNEYEVQKIKESQGIDENTKIDKNVRSVLEALVDIHGNPVDIDRSYGIAARVAEFTEYPEQFLDKLNEKFIKGKYVNSLDAWAAREMYDALSALPEEIQLPVVTQLTSVHVIPMEKLSIGDSGIFGNTSNESWSKSDINNILQSYVLNQLDRDNTVREKKKRKDTINIVKGLIKEANGAIRVYDQAGKEGTITKINDLISRVETRVEQLSGIPNIKSTWFTGIEEKYINNKSADKQTQGSLPTTLKNMTKFLSAVIEADKYYQKEAKLSPERRRQNYQKRLKDSLVVVANNLDSSYSTKGTYRNVMGNQMMSFRVGGFMHKFFNKINFRKNNNRIDSLTFLPEFLRKSYAKTFDKINNDGQPVISHSDGIQNRFTGQSIDVKVMNEADTNWYNFMLFGTSLKDGLIKTNMGVLGDRGFFTIAKVPLLNKKQYTEAYDAIQKHLKSNPKLKDFASTPKAIKAEIKYFKDIYNNLSTEEATRAFGNHSSKTLGDFVKEFAESRKGELADEYIDKNVNWDEVNETVDFEVAQRFASKQFVNEFKAHIDSEIDGIIESFVYNDIVHRFSLQSMTLSDLANFKNTKDSTKRFKGATTPYTVIDMGRDKNGKPNKIISISLKSIKTDKDAAANDSQEYVNDYYVDRVRRSGGKLIDYGNTFKAVVNGTNSDGTFHYHKTSSIGFKGVDPDSDYFQISPEYKGRDTSIPIKKSLHQRINKVLKDLSEQYPDTPIKITDEEGIKSKATGTVYTIDQLEDAVAEGFDLSNALEVDQEIHGVQLNIHKDVNKDGVDTALSTQAVNMLPSLAKSFGEEQLAQDFEEELARLTLQDLKSITKELGNKETTIKEAIKSSQNALSSIDKRMMETALEEGADTFDYVGVSRKLQNYMASRYGKALSKRVNGAELLQSIDGTGQLKYHTKGENGEVIHAEVLVPEGFAELGEELISVRIPLSAPASTMVCKVVGFTPPSSNTIVAPQGWIDASNADNDGDKLFTWKKGNKDKGEDVRYNKLFNLAMKTLRNPQLMSANGYEYELKIDNLQESVYKAKENTGQDASADAAEKRINSGIDMSTGTKMVSAKKKLDESGRLIGIFAVGSKVMHELNRLGASLVGGYSLFPTGDKIISDVELNIDQINTMAEVLQYQLDNGAEFSAHEMGITINNAPLAVIAMTSGNSSEDIFTFLNTEPIVEIEKRIKENKSVLNQDPKFVSKIIEEVKLEYANKSVKVGKDKTMSAKQIVETYEQGLALSRRPEYKLLTALTQLDKTPPNDLMTLYKLLGDIEMYKRAIGKTQQELKTLYDNGEIDAQKYYESIEITGKAKVKREGQFKFDNMLDNPVIAARVNVLNDLKVTLEKYFQHTTQKTGDVVNTQELINSFAYGRVNVNRQRLSDLINRTHTEKVAQQISREKITNSDELANLVESLVKDIEATKTGEGSRRRGKGWLSLITVDNETGLLVPMTGVSVPELGLKASQDEGLLIDEDYIEKEWNKLSNKLQNKLIDYSIYVDGFAGGAKSIMHLMPKIVYQKYQRKVKSLAKDDKGYTEEFLEEVAVRGIDDIKTYSKEEIVGDPFANTIVSRKTNLRPSKYFTLVDGNGIKHLYKTVKLGYSDKMYMFQANKITSTSSNMFGKYGDKKVVIYSADKTHLMPVEMTIDSDVEYNESDNVISAVSEKIISKSGVEEDKDDEGQLSLWQKMPSETSNENSSRFSNRVLRRLGAKFGIPYTTINDPDLKAKGYYDAVSGTVVINEAYATADTPFHEFAHPFILAIKQSNPTLYSNLVTEINGSEEGKAKLDMVAEMYPELNKSAQTEEAMVQMLGELAADKVASQPLKTALKELWDNIVTIIKSLFPNRATNIPADLAPNTKLGDLAAMLTDKSTIELDRNNDAKARQIMRKLKTLLNNTVSVTKASDVVSADIKSVYDKLSKAGFLINNRYVVRQKDDINTDIPIEFRVPMNMDNWMGELRKTYPEARILQKEKSGFAGFKKYRVALDFDNVATVYKPKNERAGTLNNAVSAGIYWSRVNPTIASNDKATYNTDKKLFNGLLYNMDTFLTENVPTPSAGQNIIARAEALLPKVLGVAGMKPNEVQAFYNLQDPKTLTKTNEFLVSTIVNEVIDDFKKVTDDDNMSGDFSDSVDVNYIRKVATDNPYEFMRAVFGQDIPSDEVADAVAKLNRAVVMSSYLRSTRNSIISNGKMISSQQIVDDIAKRALDTAQKRIDAIAKIPVVGALFKKILNASDVARDWTYKMFTPEVFSNVMTGNESNFLHALLYDAMNEGAGKDRDFKYEQNQAFKDAVPEDVMKRISNWSARLSKERDEIIADKKNTMKVVAGDSVVTMTKGEALTLYMSMRRPRMNKLILNSAGVKFIVDGKQHLLTEGDLIKFNKEIEQDNDLMIVRDAMDGVFKDIHPKLSDAMKEYGGVALEQDDKYFPVKFGKIKDVQVSDRKRRIEDFMSVKEATYNVDTANLPLRIDDSIARFSAYIDNSANFYAYSAPIMNLRKVARDMEKSESYETETHAAIKEYIIGLLDSVQDTSLLGGLTDTEFDRQMQKYMNAFTVAVLGYNPSVMAKQVVSVVSASTELDRSIITNPEYRDVAASVISSSFKNDTDFKRTELSTGTIGKLNMTHPVIAEMNKKSSLARQRFGGYIDRDQGEYRAHAMGAFSEEGKKTKFFGKELDLQKSMEGIKIMDAAAMAFIWSSVKDSMAGKYKVGSDEYWNAVNEKFEQVVNRTQPTYDVVNRTELGRSKNTMLRLFTMFSSQRAKNMNMMVDSLNTLLLDPDEAARKKMQWTLAAVGLWSSLSIAAIDKLKYTLYGNDDDEGVWENLLGLGKGTAMTTLGNFYGLGQFAGMVEAHATNKPYGKTIEHPVIQTFSMAANALAHFGKGEMIKSGDKALQTTMRLGGIPLFPYTTLIRRPIKAIGGSKKSKSSEDKSPTYHSSNEDSRKEISKMMRKRDKIELQALAQENNIKFDDKTPSKELAAKLVNAGIREVSKTAKK